MFINMDMPNFQNFKILHHPQNIRQLGVNKASYLVFFVPTAHDSLIVMDSDLNFKNHFFCRQGMTRSILGHLHCWWPTLY